MRLLNLFLFVLVYPYATDRQLLEFSLNIPPKGLPLVIDLPAHSFAVQLSVCAVPREYHQVNVEVVPPLYGNRCHARERENTMMTRKTWPDGG